MAGVQAGQGLSIRLGNIGFNPSVGMAGVQARGVVGDSPGNNQFQSLSRDGGGSSFERVLLAVVDAFVSIPQSGWRGFKRDRVSTIEKDWSSFNPSVGMAGVQA